jgi:class 3 adenylate cyclase/tetratricopeptide (TPR) repeat protein
MATSRPDGTGASLILRLFGPSEIRLNGKPLPRLRTRKERWLLALLALRHGAEVERQWLAGMLWPESISGQTLRNTLADLRRVLGPDAARLRSPTPRTLSLDLRGADVDVIAFDRAIARGDTAALEEAVSLYRGPLLEECAEEWVLQERQQREHDYLDALERLASQSLEAGDPASAEGYLRRAGAVDPLRESVQRARMRALAAGSNHAGLLQCYRDFRLLLHRELNTEPDPETQALFRRLRDQARQTAAAVGSNPAARPVSPSVPNARSVVLPAGENRVVTVLFADMSGSLEATRDLAPEEAAQLVDRLLQAMVTAVQECEGRIDRFQGDGVMAVFGVRQAHEEDPERAIRAALAIREAARRMGIEVTAGINTGEAYAGAVGPAQYREVTVIGRAVSLAARLQGEGLPGEILVGEATYQQTRRAFVYTPRTAAIKGLARPITIYRVDQALSRPEKSRGLEGLRAELIGRAEEWAKLQQAFAQALQGQGRIVALIGEPGVGKSRLVADLKGALGSGLWALGSEQGGGSLADYSLQVRHHPEPPLWLEGRCTELETSVAYGPFLDLLRRCFDIQPEDDAALRTHRVLSFLQELAAQGDLPDGRIQETAVPLCHLLSAHFGDHRDEWPHLTSPEQILHGTFLAIRDLCLALSRRAPLILVLEDLHWADTLSLDLIAFLMESIADAALLMLCVYRPEPEHRCRHLGTIARHKCPERYTELTLRELTPTQSVQLVQSLLLGATLPDRLLRTILEQAAGNPFFVEEVLRSLIDQEVLCRDGDRWVVREGLPSDAVPMTVQSMIQSRVDRLDSEVKRVLQWAAVIGRRVPVRLLDRISPSAIELEVALSELEGKGLVYQEQVVPERVYSFQHALTQETIYHGLLQRERVSIHRDVAEAMEALYASAPDPQHEALAHHYERGGCAPKAVEYLHRAGEKAKQRSAGEAAATSFERALALLEGLPSAPERAAQELRLLTSLGPVLIAGRGYGAPEVEQVYRRARDLCDRLGNAPELFPVIGGLWSFRLARADCDGARELGEELFRVAQGQADPALMMVAQISLGCTRFWQGEFAPCLEHVERGLELYDPAEHRSLMFLFGLDFGVLGQDFAAWSRWFLGYPDQAWRQGEEALQRARELSHPFTLMQAVYLPLVLRFFERDVSSVQERVEEIITLATEQGFPFWAALGMLDRGWVWARSGAPDEGLAAMRQAIATIEGLGFDLGQTCSAFELADACHHLGEVEEGLAAVEMGLAAAGRTGERYLEAELHRLKGELLLRSAGNETEAEACFLQALEVARRQQAKSWELPAAISLARLWRRQGKRAEARALLAGLYGWFTEGLDTPTLREARELLDTLL